VQLHTFVRRKLDPSDVVQQTMLRAIGGWGELKSQEPAAVAAWLRRILARTLADAVRDLLRGKRDIAMERSLEAAVADSSARFGAMLPAAVSSPSARLQAEEQHLALADALMQLPTAMRTAVVLKHCQGWSLKQIAETLDRSPAAVASLLRRGLEQLRTILREGA
jgi:RNA polymerase sigma-70 factor (ECF subfamily)